MGIVRDGPFLKHPAAVQIAQPSPNADSIIRADSVREWSLLIFSVW